MRICGLFLIPLALAGCAGSAVTPLHQPLVTVAECRWEAPAGMEKVDYAQRVVRALEAEGFRLRDSDMALGLISAERTSAGPLRAYGFPFDRHPWHSLGLGYHRPYPHLFGAYHPDYRAIDQERVSVWLGTDEVRVGRDVRRREPNGVTRTLGRAGNAGFCRGLKASIEETAT
ncbi:hypothetical protein ACFQH5_12015 [Halomonas salifodinae]|uniref:DUF4136 domain-containing protein n=1 Tax=Halomonas salifodinae TaxID=438745 RepID=A0ABW2EWB1_9GAMM